MGKRLNIAFLWHMHQPLYKDPFTEEYVLPWVLLHCTKDYYDMVSILDAFPAVHQTINLVPCLITQINDYASGSVKDLYRGVSLKPASKLTREDKIFILKNFFQANWENMIKPVPRYWELLRRRGTSNALDDLQPVLRYFREQDYLDLQVLFNLVWIDPSIRNSDEFLSRLSGKGRGFTEDEKAILLTKQIEIARRILPKYSEMMDRGAIEVSTSPYYHPIMPLLFDSDSAKTAMPEATLPKRRFSHPEDVRAQIEKGIRLYMETFGRMPKGLWPSEGSVSAEILPVVAAEGIEWLATDEEILSQTLKRPIRRDSAGNCHDGFLYTPYSIDAGAKKLSILFRDHVLSDLIGFDYARMDPDAAADDFISRLAHIYNLFEHPEEHVVPIILDGENAWENYRNDGWDFLTALYTRLSGHPRFSCVTISEFLAKTHHRENLKWLYPGSWINHNFKIWIGHTEDNTAWDYISDARNALALFAGDTAESADKKKEVLEKAWDEIYAAEGSDWFWWYGEEHSSMSDEQFDTLFRRHLKKVYALAGKEPPLALDIPITTEERGFRPLVLPTSYINPVIDGEISNYFEWLAAGRLQRAYYGTAMHKDVPVGGLTDGISYGFSKEALFFRFDYHRSLIPYEKEWSFNITIIHPVHLKIHAIIKGSSSMATVFKKPSDGDVWAQTFFPVRIASDRVVECAAPLEEAGIKKGDEIRLFIDIDAGEQGLERWPLKGVLILDVPTTDFEYENWLV